ncbi:hypothetical protein WA588_001599 [Blastocystis sp. NMH]
MNTSDSEIMDGLLKENDMVEAKEESQADVIIMNTCSVREHAEKRIWNRLTQFRHLDKKKKKHTILCVSGCMAPRLREKLLASGVDVVVGPDSYLHLPLLLSEALSGHQAADTALDASEVYASVSPRLTDPLPVTQLTIMRGCNNMCSYCVVPYTRGQERSVPVPILMDSVRRMRDHGYKEVLLLGQNVNSYCDDSRGNIVRFPELLSSIAEIAPEMRIRFMSPHPKDFPREMLEVIRDHRNICRCIHLPVQSGSSSCLRRMNRPYTHEEFVRLVEEIRCTLPGCSVSTDVISGFCGETEAEHEDTVRLMTQLRFDHAFMYLFSLREETYAWRHLRDDVTPAEKQRRLEAVQAAFYAALRGKVAGEAGRRQLVLVEGESRRSGPGRRQWRGRNDGNRMCVFDEERVPRGEGGPAEEVAVGDFVVCRVMTPGTGTNVVKPLFKTTLQEFVERERE